MKNKDKISKLEKMKYALNRTKYGVLLAAMLTGSKLNVNAGDADTKKDDNQTGIFYYENGAPYVDTLSQVLDNLPYSVRAMLLHDHYVICAVGHNTDIETYVYNVSGDQGVQGICVAYPGQTGIGFGYIYVETYDPDIISIYNTREQAYVQQYGMDAVLRRHKISVEIHEIGHAVYYHEMMKVPNYDAMLAEIYAAEKNSFYTTLYHTQLSYDFDSCYNQYEYFAEAFACYYLYPQELATKCPRTYKFVSDNLALLNQEFPAPIKGSVYTKEK